MYKSTTKIWICKVVAAAAKIDKSYYRQFLDVFYSTKVIHKLPKNSYIHFYIYHYYSEVSNNPAAIVECFCNFSNSGVFTFYYRIKGFAHEIDNQQFAIGYYKQDDYYYIISPNGAYGSLEKIIHNNGVEDLYDTFDKSISAKKYLSGSNF